MIYHAYEAYERMMAPLQWLAQQAAHHLAQPWPGMAESGWPPSWPASLSVMAQARLTHARPEFGIDRVTIGNRELAVREEVALRRPFCTLLHFAKDIAATQPRVLIVAPLSGHFATLLRGTVSTMLPEPIRQPGSMTHPSRCAMWPTTQSAPMTVGHCAVQCTIVPSCTDVRAPTEMWPWSPRSTAPGHTEACGPIVTRPITTASGAT